MYEYLRTITFCLAVGISSLVFGQTTGKLTGLVTDKATGDPLLGVNVMINNTSYGTASANDGRFNIINVPPGNYSVSVMMIGYTTVKIIDVRISTNRTATLDIKMEQTVLEGDVVEVQVDRIYAMKDQTGTIKNISSEDIEALVIENIDDVINLQAGIVAGHFRGGRSTEVTYLVDGIPIKDTFGGVYRSVDIEPEVIKDLEVITGTFNAEYGSAMSGVVNMVTRDGGAKFEGSATIGLSNFVTGNDNIFIGLDRGEIDRNKDLKFQLSGPVLKNKLTFFTNIRYQDNNGHLNGIRRFNVDDYSNFSSDLPVFWYSEHTGDSAYVPMNRSENFSFFGKLSLKAGNNIRLSALFIYNDDVWHNYDHSFKYNPDGMAADHRTSNLTTLHLNHMLSPNLFYDLKFSSLDTYTGNYLYKDPLDDKYVHDGYLNDYGPGFYTGGQQKDHSERTQIDNTVKFDMVWQVNFRNSLKWGGQYIIHDIDQQWHEIRNLYFGMDISDIEYEPVIYGNSTVYGDVYNVKPYETAFYIQDKLEFDEMVINLGIRYDLFEPETTYPSDPRNPGNQLILPDSMMSDYPDAPAITQFSPRFGLAYQLGNQAVLHFSYGHFFQMPPMWAMYQNNSKLVPPSDYSVIMGNPNLKPEKTISFEIGLWQELSRNIGLEVSLFYKDIYNLLSGKIISTYNQIQYALLSNKDYGNVRGLEIKMDMNWGNIKSNVNYTLMYTRGNADYPLQTFDRAGNSTDPVNRFIPMSWDQRHTFNSTINVIFKSGGMTVTGFYNSGTPYTFTPLTESVLSRINLYPNNDIKPENYSVDVSIYRRFKLFSSFNAKAELVCYNVFDKLNENDVNSQTGRAYTSVIQETDIAGHRSNFNEYIDRIENPSMFSEPRHIKVILGVDF